MQTKVCLPLDQIVQRCEELISYLGIELQSGTDFEVFKYFVDRSERETPLDPIFTPSKSDIDHVDGQWLLGRDRHGNIVQTQAVRAIELGGLTLSEFMKSKINVIRPFGYDVNLGKTRWRLSPDASRIKGDVYYHGGLWIRKDFRGGCFATLITRYLLAKTMIEQAPDFLIGLQAPFTGCRGLSAKEGYLHLEQRTILWHLNNSQDVFEDWMVWMSREEAHFNLSIPPEDFFAMFEKTDVPVLKTA